MAKQLSPSLIALGFSMALVVAPVIAHAQNEPPPPPPPGYTVQVQVQPGQPPPVVVQPPPPQAQPGQVVVVQPQPGQVMVQPMPGQAPGQVYYAPPGYYPPPAAPPRGPKKIDWEEGEPIPPGYHAVTRARVGLVAGGASMFGATYLISILVGSVMQDTSGHNGYSLLIPVAGPFVEMRYSGYASVDVVLALDGLAQAAGLAMLIAGIAAPKTVLVRDFAGVTLMPKPIFGQNSAGFGLAGAF